MVGSFLCELVHFTVCRLSSYTWKCLVVIMIRFKLFNFRMLISLGDLKCTIGTQRFFPRILRLLDGSSRLSCGCSCRRSMAALLFHPNSAQHATTSHPYLVNNISTTRGFYDSRRFLYRTDSVCLTRA